MSALTSTLLGGVLGLGLTIGGPVGAVLADTVSPDSNAVWNTNAGDDYAAYEDQTLSIVVDADACDTDDVARLTIAGVGTGVPWFDASTEFEADGTAVWSVEMPDGNSPGGGLNTVVFQCSDGAGGTIRSERLLYNTVLVETGGDTALALVALGVLGLGAMLLVLARRPLRAG